MLRNKPEDVGVLLSPLKILMSLFFVLILTSEPIKDFSSYHFCFITDFYAFSVISQTTRDFVLAEGRRKPS